MTVTARTADLVGGRPVVPSCGVLRPLGLAEVQITGGFWAQRQQLNGAATLAHGLSWMQRLGWVDNFASEASRYRDADRRGREFSDSEVYKLVEAMCWEEGRSPEAGRDGRIDTLVELIAGAQAPDGYLHTAFGRPGQRPRYSDLAWGHELYCTGHLLQAAVAAARVGRGHELMSVARRAADHVCATFDVDGHSGICGHPEIEPALVELARVTGEQRYLDQAQVFLNRRGHRSLAPHQFGWSYFSDDTPVRKSTVMRGHAVRALYLACGAVDAAVETNDDELLEAIAAQFDRTLAKRTYLTGGMGSRHADEAFGDDYVLPADRAYAETCAGVAAIMLAWRLMLATGREDYADIIERILYNIIATSVGDDGRSFFYANTLHQRTATLVLSNEEEQLGVGGGPRAPWFEVSCCLANIARLLASLSGYLASVDDEGLRIHQYADADIETSLADGRRIGVRMNTEYPDNGLVRLLVTAADGGPWELSLRLPAWAAKAEITVNGEPHPVTAGRTGIRRDFAVGDRIELRLPLRPRFTHPDPRIDAVRGCVAIEKGPLVLCAESADGLLDLDALRVDTQTTSLGEDRATVRGFTEELPGASWPYPDGGPVGQRIETPIVLVPYHRWARRGPSTMRVWLPTV